MTTNTTTLDRPEARRILRDAESDGLITPVAMYRAIDALDDEDPAGVRVPLRGTRWVVTLTADGVACDCGKGLLCPLNPQIRVK